MKRLLLLALLAAAPQAQAADKLTVMLDWFVNPDHGPIIVANQLGYFKDAGLDVKIIAPSDPAEPPKMVAAGKADLAVAYQPQLYLQHQEGLPLVRVGTLVDTPLYCVLTKADGPVKTLADLKGRKVGYSVAGVEQALLGGMLQHNGVAPDQVTWVNVNFSLVPALASGQVAAVSGAFRNFEPHQLAKLGQQGRCFKPEDNGIPPYDELIYEANPKTMKRDSIVRFLLATEKAVAYIKAHPEEAWKAYTSYAKDLGDTLNREAWQDSVHYFDPKPMALDAKRYADFGAFMAAAKLIPAAPKVAEIAIDPSQAK
ncbi:MAG: ABC transporter substrate-binding protein [Paracoccaceae bacterium]|nr:ABC transporter substrate-binding protein [Paracoccaceae bacterium]